MLRFQFLVLTMSIFLSACSENKLTSDRDPNASATYKANFTTFWKASDFPVNFPGGAHFSGLIGATHNNQIKIWEAGQIASAGIESMAETGSKSALQSEIEAAKLDGKAEFLLSGGGNGASGTTELEFDINETYSLVSLVSMVAPSPDWFVGVRDVELYDNVIGDWKNSVTVNLAVYDSGSDNGVIFTSANSDSQPKGIISTLSSNATDTDFINGVHNGTGQFIATMVFTRVSP